MTLKAKLRELIGPNGKINKRKLKHGSLATALTVLFIVAIVLINIVATMLFERYPISLDLTDNSIYSISDDTIEYISNIDSPVDITVMATEDAYRSLSDYTVQCAELLKKYQQYNPNISVSYKDLLSSPDFVANYSQSLESGDIIIELANGEHDRVKVVSLTDIINVVDDYASYLTTYSNYYGAEYTHSLFNSYGYIKSSNAEQAITSAIMGVTDSNPVTVAVLSYKGAEASDVSGLTDLLDKNGYVITNVDIRTQELTDDIDIIVIPAPKIDYTAVETAKIETWLTNGGELEKDMIYVASVEQPKTPNLDALLEKYGITVEYKTIHETNTNYYSAYTNYTFQYIATEDHLDDVANTYLPVYVPDARAISTRYDAGEGYYSNEVIVSSTSSAVLKDMYSADENWSAETATGRASYASCVLATYKALNQDTHISKYTTVLVIGSDLMLNSSLMSAAQYNNGDLLLSIINEISGKSEGITIISKVVSSNTFDITEAQIRTLTATFAVVIPAVILVLGIIIWIRRRHR